MMSGGCLDSIEKKISYVTNTPSKQLIVINKKHNL